MGAKKSKQRKLVKNQDDLVRNLENELKNTKEYRLGYPDLKDNNDKSKNANITFLFGEIVCAPRGDYIHNIHEKWWGDYHKLEAHHGYIQWLFPLRVKGVNYAAQPLQLHEIETLMSEENKEKTKNVLLKSYEMMLDFYGMKLVNVESCELERNKNYTKRYQNLIERSHNNLRITRILKCLGEFDLENYQIGFIEFLLHEVFETEKLVELSNVLTRYWIHTVKNDDKRKELIQKARSMIMDLVHPINE